jgi:integrating conjugative element protein (TIGR03746 family)
MRFTNALEQSKWHIVSLYAVILLLFILAIGLIIGWHSTQSEITIHYPPEIPTNGLTIKAHDYPKARIFSFAFYAWQSINDWQADGVKDYQNNIKNFSSYLTPRFKNYLINDYNQRYNSGEIQSRLRTMQGMNGTAFDFKNVMYLGHGTWLVHLNMRLIERMNNNSKRVKDVEVDYTLRVVRYQINATKNQWGLALDGFATNPKRIKTFV